jgi:hypothetical protein
MSLAAPTFIGEPSKFPFHFNTLIPGFFSLTGWIYPLCFAGALRKLDAIWRRVLDFYID